MRLFSSIAFLLLGSTTAQQIADWPFPLSDVAAAAAPQLTGSSSIPSHGLSILGFYEPYCQPCERVLAHMRNLKARYWDLDIFFGAINVDRYQNGQSVPLPQFVAMRDGKAFEQLFADDSVVIMEMDRVVSQYAAEMRGGGGSNGGGGNNNNNGGDPDDGGDVEPLLRQLL